MSQIANYPSQAPVVNECEAFDLAFGSWLIHGISLEGKQEETDEFAGRVSTVLI